MGWNGGPVKNQIHFSSYVLLAIYYYYYLDHHNIPKGLKAL